MLQQFLLLSLTSLLIFASIHKSQTLSNKKLLGSEDVICNTLSDTNSDMTPVKYFQKILDIQTAIGYSFPNSLNPPANAQQIREVENKLGFKLDKNLKELYLFANGSYAKQTDQADNHLIPLHRFLSLSDVIQYYSDNIKNDFVFDELFVNLDRNEKPKKKLFPFLADDSHCYWLDLNEGTKNYGRIYVAYYAGENPEYQFNSLNILFQVIFECYRDNIYYLDPTFKTLSSDFLKYRELCQRLNPDIEYWKVVTENWKKHSMEQ